MKILDQAKQPDGGLHLTDPVYIAWGAGDGGVTLDGEFTPEDLEAIAAYIRARQ